MKKLKSFFSGMYLTLIFIFLYAPIVTLIIFSFNEKEAVGKDFP